MQKNNNQILVVVHPGSACGSADFNLGLDEGARQRHALCKTLHQWSGDTIIIDGELSDELHHYAQLGLAIENLPSAKRVDACSMTEGWVDKAWKELSTHQDKHLLLTGAWHHPEDRAGCIDAVASRLDQEKVPYEILTCALRL